MGEKISELINADVSSSWIHRRVSAIRRAYQSSVVHAPARLCKNLAGGGPIDAYKYREKHIKCTGYCRRASCRQLLISCCQPRTEVNQSNRHTRTLICMNTYANTYANVLQRIRDIRLNIYVAHV